jgi:hypothetical protein
MDTGKNYAEEKRAAATGFRVGQNVFHNKFGEGDQGAGRRGRRCARQHRLQAPRRQVAGAVGGEAGPID